MSSSGVLCYSLRQVYENDPILTLVVLSWASATAHFDLWLAREFFGACECNVFEEVLKGVPGVLHILKGVDQ